MATLQTLRNRAGILVASIIGFALFAFILSDFLGKGSQMSQISDYDVAEVDGKTISLMELQNKIEYLTEIASLYSGKSAIDEERVQQIQDQSWQQLLHEYILTEEYEKLGLSVNSEEVFDMVQGRNIHPFIQNLFADPNTGQINTANILRFLKTMDQDPSGNQKKYWLFLEKEMITERMFNKYTTLIAKGLYTTDQYAEKIQNENSKKVNIDYLVKRYTSIPDSAVTFDESDLKKYYKKHKNNYKQEALRSIDYIIIDVIPSADDDLMAKQYIDNLVDDFKTTEVDKDFVNLNSDETFIDRNYTYDELPESIKDFMFKAKIGDMYGPYFEDNTYKIAKLSEINYLPDSVKARHILIDAGKTQESAKAAKEKADSLKDIIEKGGNFFDLAKQYSIDGSAEKGGDLGWFKEGQMVKPFNDACFTSETGKIQVVETQFGYHVIQVTDKSNNSKKVKVAIVERHVEPSTGTYQFYYSKTSQFGGKYNTYELFSEGAQKEGLLKRSATGIKEFDKTIPGIESPREIIRWAYEADIHDLSPIFEIGGSFIIAILSEIQEEGITPLENMREMVTREVIKLKKAEIIKTEFEEYLNSSNQFEQLASIMSLEIKQAPNIRFSSNSLPDAGMEPAVIATAIVLNENNISSPIKGNNGVYLIKVTSIDEEVFGDVMTQKQNLLRRNQQRASYEAYNTLEKLANIKDYRYKFY